MMIAYLESLKYVGHLWPVALFRMAMGYWFLRLAVARVESDYLLQPKLAALISETNSSLPSDTWWTQFLDHVVVPYWQFFAYTQVYTEFLVGISFLLGFFVRPVALAGALLAISLVSIDGPMLATQHRLETAVFLLLAWVGAGRCLGLDYYFYKRHRGWMW
jgi:thiosulfate dehydrogenase [quinone] large subunit